MKTLDQEALSRCAAELSDLRAKLASTEARAERAEGLLQERHVVIRAAYGEGMCESSGETQHAKLKNQIVMSWLDRCDEALTTPPQRTDGEREIQCDGRTFPSVQDAALHLLWVIQRLSFYDKEREGQPCDGFRIRQCIIEARKLLGSIGYESTVFGNTVATAPQGRTDGERLELPKFLLEMAERLRAQDNLATSYPLYCVFVKERVYGIDMNFDPQYAWIDQTSGEYIEATDEEAKQLEAMDAAGGATILDGCEYEKTGFVEKERFITASLTRAGAEEHLRLNGHNIPGAYIYVTSLHRTPDMIALREWLMSLTAPEVKGGAA